MATGGLAVAAGASIFSMAHADASRSNLPPLVVILDPGHGGDDTGAMRLHHGHVVAEKDLTLALARETKRSLQAANIPVILTRTADTSVSLERRTSIANDAASLGQSAVFISIHANSSGENQSSGIETFVFNATNNEASQRLADLENGKRWNQNHATLDLILADLATTANYGESVRLAREIQKTVVLKLKANRQPTRNRGVRQALFYVLMQTHMPAVLLEPGFLSNPRELYRLLSPDYRGTLAQALSRAIVAWNATTAATTASAKQTRAPQPSFSTAPEKTQFSPQLKVSGIAKH